jgi:excisionase family DNA binding protein
MTDIQRQAFTINEICQRYGVCRETVYKAIRAGRLRARKIGDKTVVLRADAEAYETNLPELKLPATA